MQQYRRKNNLQVFGQVTKENFLEAQKVCNILYKTDDIPGFDIMLKIRPDGGGPIGSWGNYLVKDESGDWSLHNEGFIKDYEPVTAPSVPENLTELAMQHCVCGTDDCSHVSSFKLGYKKALTCVQPQSEGGFHWVKCSEKFPEDIFSKIIKDTSLPFLHLIIEENVKAIEADCFLMEDGTRVYFEDAEWLNESSSSTANTEEGAEPKVRSLEEQAYDAIEIGDTIRLYGKETKVKNFAATFNQSLERWETVIITEGRGDPFERSIDVIEVWNSEENKWIPASSLRIIPH